MVTRSEAASTLAGSIIFVLVIFGTKRLSSIGSDLGGAVKGFRKAVTEAEQAQLEDEKDADAGVAPEQSREHADR